MKQKMRFSEPELALLKSIFAEDDDTIQAVRKVFFEIELTDKDKDKLKALQSKEAKTLIRKVFLPDLNLDAPVGQMIDLLMTVNFSEKSADDAFMHIKARHITIELISKHLDELVGEGVATSFKPLAELSDNAEDAFINLTARNSYISHVEAMLQQINLLAGMKKESPEQTLERLQKDSAK